MYEMPYGVNALKVERKKKRAFSSELVRTALAGPNMLLRPATPTTQLFVSRLHHSTKVGRGVLAS